MTVGPLVRLGVLLSLVVPAVWAQRPPLSPRDLYLESFPAAANGPPGTAVPVALHLGLRYTLLLVDPETKRAREADPDGTFKEGDCFAVEFAPNRSGHLYVFNHGSAGEWQLLMPSPLMPEEADSVKASVPVRIPREYCFRLDNKPGTETLVVAVTERQEDVDKLHAVLSTYPATGGSPELVRTAAARGEIEAWQRMAGRDLMLEKVDQPGTPQERPHTVYAVMSSAAENGRLVVEIKIRHE